MGARKKGLSLPDVPDEMSICRNISRVFVHDAGVVCDFAVFCRLLSFEWVVFLLRRSPFVPSRASLGHDAMHGENKREK